MTEDASFTPDVLWDELRLLLRWLAGAFGGPGDLADARRIEARSARVLRTWLVGLEALARALLAILAAGLQVDAPGARAAGWRRARVVAGEDDSGFEVAGPIAFSLGVAAPGGVARPSEASQPLSMSRTRGGEDDDELDGWVAAWPLARRFEALMRVADAPELYAARLARRLRADPSSRAQLLRPPPWSSRGVPRSLIYAAQDLARGALEPPHARILPPDSG